SFLPLRSSAFFASLRLCVKWPFFKSSGSGGSDRLLQRLDADVPELDVVPGSGVRILQADVSLERLVLGLRVLRLVDIDADGVVADGRDLGADAADLAGMPLVRRGVGPLADGEVAIERTGAVGVIPGGVVEDLDLIASDPGLPLFGAADKDAAV